MSAEDDELGNKLAKIAHDLRGPLQLISGHAELIGFKSTNQDLRKHIDSIVETTSYLGALADDLLILYKGAEFEAEMITTQMHEPLSKVIKNSVELFSAYTYGGQLEFAQDIQCDFSIKNGFRIQRILQNLLANSHQNCSGTLVAHVKAEMDADNLIITLADNSRGLNKDSRKKDATSFNHSGLGIIIITELVKLYEGWITWRIEGQSVVRIYLPLTHIVAEEKGEDDVLDDPFLLI